jgi:hypothetical protein
MWCRRGSLLIIVSGFTALLAALALAFISRMRADASDMAWVVRETQARIMLVSACNYIQEASRLGWDDPSTPEHEEGFGWIDVRDGKLGPKPIATGTDDDSRFPIGRSARFPLYVMTRPPFAIQPQMVYNPLRTPFSDEPVDESNPQYGMPFLVAPDPQPVVDNGWSPSNQGATVSPSNWATFAAGNRNPVMGTSQQAWFRVYRNGPADFVVTCGGAGTLGFRDWAEVTAAGEGDRFANDPEVFYSQEALEVRLWYRVQWSAAVAAPTRNHQVSSWSIMDDQKDQDKGTAIDDGSSNATDSARYADNYVTRPINIGHTIPWDCQMFGANPVGTITMIMRLRNPPTHW